MWMLALSVVAFAITLSQTIFFVVLGSAYVVYGICYVVIIKRKEERQQLDRGTKR